MIEHNGYEAEKYNVRTFDGYIMTIFRCYSKDFASNLGQPVLLGHGILATSDQFVMAYKNQSLGTIESLIRFFSLIFDSFSNGFNSIFKDSS